jgi:ATP-dependent Clp protease ATP-binding subunit ClpC
MLRHTRAKFAELGIAMELHPKAAAQLARCGSDPVHGARTLRRTITGQIEDPAADLLLSGALTAGRTLNILPGDAGLTLHVS